jgi:class 3 adenylate cyclase
MPELPSGTVTFLFSDIEGSTRLLEELGDGYVALLQEHNRIFREVIREHEGAEVSTEGDSFFVVFRSSIECYRCGSRNTAKTGRSTFSCTGLDQLRRRVIPSSAPGHVG